VRRHAQRWVTVIVFALAACSSRASGQSLEGETTSTTVGETTTSIAVTASSTTTVTAPAPTTTIVAGPPKVVVTPTGVVLPVLGVEDGGQLHVRTVCGGEASYSGAGKRYNRVQVVLDPGHGGFDPGAVQNGIRESDVNLDVALRTRAYLERAGIDVVLTREFDYYVPFVVRGELALNSNAALFVSIHHNSGRAPLISQPGTEVYYQQLDAKSRRLAGLLWEDVTAALRVHPIQWYGADDAGALFRQGRTGPDFYGVLRRTAGVPATLLEIAYLSNPTEAALVATEAFREESAAAIAHAIERYFNTDDQGAGFSGSRGAGPPTTPTGGTAGCVEPPYE